MNLNFTVAIPTYNGAKTLPLVLERLRSQITPENLTWEVIVVDNNSTDNTAQIVQEFQANWHSHSSLKYCLETQQGITYARMRAIQEARGTFVGFLDDDNLPAIDWVAAATQFGQSHSQVGAYGGEIQGDFEVTPPAGFGKAAVFLAVKKYSSHPKQYEPEKLRLPPGAGLVVRRAAWLESMPHRLSRLQRGGNDYEISLHLYNRGWEIWYNPAMVIQHKIPAWRMEKRYVTRIARLYGVCTCEIRVLIAASSWEKSAILVRSFLGGIRHFISHLLRYRSRALTEIGLACELSFFLGNILSPFHYLHKQITSPSFTSPSKSVSVKLEPQGRLTHVVAK